jgi:hypothetical protein
VADDVNVYFTDTDASSNTEIFAQAPLAGGPAITLYKASTSGTVYSLVGSDGNTLFFTANPASGSGPSTINTVPIGKLSSSPTVIANFDSYIQGNLAVYPGSLRASAVLVGTYVFGSQSLTPLASAVISPTGTQLQSTPSSTWAAVSQYGHALQMRGLSGGAFEFLDYDWVNNTFSAAPFTDTDGNAVSTTEQLSKAFYLSGTIATGFLSTSSFAADQSTKTVVLLSMPNTYVLPF